MRERLEREIIRQEERLRIAAESRAKYEVDLAAKQKALEASDKLRALVQQVASDTQSKLKLRFEAIVQACLDSVFPNEYNFVMDFVTRRGQTEVDFYLEKDGKQYAPMTSNGGGVVDVISIALRICCIILSGKSRVLLLDEPFKHVREGAKERLGNLIEIVADKLKMQVIMVGDVGGNYIEGNEIKIKKVNGVSVAYN